MVAQHGNPVQEGSNTATTALTPALALTMAAAAAAPAGFHDTAAMAAGASTGDTTLDFSVSPQKEDEQMPGASRRRTASGRGHSRTPSDRSLSSSRTASVKRGNAGTGGRPPRGSADSPWDDDRRAVHRRVQFPDNPHASVESALQALQLQSEADREHMGMLKNAIEGIYYAQRQQMADFTAAAQRADSLETAQERDREMARAELIRSAGEIPVRINGVIDDKVQQINAELTKVTLYLEQLDRDRPVEGVTLVEPFRLLGANISEMKSKLNAYSQHTDGQIAAAQGCRYSRIGHHA